MARDEVRSKRWAASRSRARLLFLWLWLAGIAWGGIVGCGFNDEPEEAQALWEKLQQAQYRKWAPVPGFATPQPAKQPFHNLLDSRPLMVTIYMNEIMANAAKASAPLKAWPEGALLVKDAFQGDDWIGLVAMEKRKGSWFWVQWNPDGSATHSGQPSDCINCHTKHADNDMLATVALPR